MIEKYIRQSYQTWLVDPFARRVKKIISPNQVTLLSVLAGLLIMPSLMTHQLLLCVCLLTLSGYLDTLDGTLARMGKNATPWGSVLDIFSDRLVEFAIILALFLVDPSTRAMGSLLMLGSVLLCVTSFLVVGIFTPNEGEKGFHYSSGLMERAEAFVFFALMMMFPTSFSWLSLTFAGLVLMTAFIRLYEFYRHTRTSLTPC